MALDVRYRPLDDLHGGQFSARGLRHIDLYTVHDDGSAEAVAEVLLEASGQIHVGFDDRVFPSWEIESGLRQVPEGSRVEKDGGGVFTTRRLAATPPHSISECPFHAWYGLPARRSASPATTRMVRVLGVLFVSALLPMMLGDVGIVLGGVGAVVAAGIYCAGLPKL